MKNLHVILLAFAVCLLAACLKGPSEGDAPVALSKEQKDLVTDKDSGFCIMDNLTLWEIGSGAPKSLSACGIGEKLVLLGKTTRAVLSGAPRDLILVRQSTGSEGWARAEYVIADSVLAVIVDDEAAVYSKPSAQSASGKSLPRMTIVAIHKSSAGTAFLRISCVEQSSQALFKGVYLRNSGVSSLMDDVKSAVLFRIASRTENSRKRAAFLASALSDYPRSRFSPDIRLALKATQEPISAEIPTEKFASSFLINEDGVNVLSLPEDSGAIVATLPKGRVVESVGERTQAPYTIGSLSAPWYKIKDPEGWVFGVSLSPKQ